MNVKELKEALREYDDGNEVVIEVNGQAVPVVAHAKEYIDPYRESRYFSGKFGMFGNPTIPVTALGVNTDTAAKAAMEYVGNQKAVRGGDVKQNIGDYMWMERACCSLEECLFAIKHVIDYDKKCHSFFKAYEAQKVLMEEMSGVWGQIDSHVEKIVKERICRDGDIFGRIFKDEPEGEITSK